MRTTVKEVVEWLKDNNGYVVVLSEQWKDVVDLFIQEEGCEYRATHRRILVNGDNNKIIEFGCQSYDFHVNSPYAHRWSCAVLSGIVSVTEHCSLERHGWMAIQAVMPRIRAKTKLPSPLYLCSLDSVLVMKMDIAKPS